MTAHLAGIWRHPIKAHGREELMRVTLGEGETMPWDRRWAVAHEMAQIDPVNPQWEPCANFSRGAKAPRLQAITARVNHRRGEVTLSYPGMPDLTINPDKPEDGLSFIQWVMPISPGNRALPSRLVRVEGRGMTDTDWPSISLVNLASHRAVAQRVGRAISPLRWRANLLLDGFAPWEEREWIGKRLRIGAAELEVRENIVRCLATAASTRTGERDTDTLGALEEGWGHREFGVYAAVVKTGEFEQGDQVEVLG
jgi:uncharacterized protein YcbX